MALITNANFSHSAPKTLDWFPTDLVVAVARIIAVVALAVVLVVIIVVVTFVISFVSFAVAQML